VLLVEPGTVLLLLLEDGRLTAEVEACEAGGIVGSAATGPLPVDRLVDTTNRFVEALGGDVAPLTAVTGGGGCPSCPLLLPSCTDPAGRVLIALSTATSRSPMVINNI
jgi:hypothetical protein